MIRPNLQIKTRNQNSPTKNLRLLNMISQNNLMTNLKFRSNKKSQRSRMINLKHRSIKQSVKNHMTKLILLNNMKNQNNLMKSLKFQDNKTTNIRLLSNKRNLSKLMISLRPLSSKRNLSRLMISPINTSNIISKRKISRRINLKSQNLARNVLIPRISMRRSLRSITNE